VTGGATQRSPQSLIWSASLHRAAKFALVGAVGVLVQLAVLQALTMVGVSYLWATALAVEAAVLNNFMWHRKCTWSDRSGSDLARLLRFHLSNGTISILGGVLLMRWFVGQFGMGLLIANLLTIVACSVGNFLASDRWVFHLPVKE
jgi:putative flippase GtrA